MGEEEINTTYIESLLLMRSYMGLSAVLVSMYVSVFRLNVKN